MNNIEINKIDDFPNHPFKVIDDQNYKELKESIKQSGVVVPVVLREKDNGRYEMISGHRRKHISKELGIDVIPSIVLELTDEEATIIMVDTNLHREKILPSEKAFAYKMKYDAIKEQHKKTPLVSDKRLDEHMGDLVGESREQIRRYIRLTYLSSDLLKLVDDTVLKDKRTHLTMGIRPAVELSYLSMKEQQAVYQEIIYQDSTPSYIQAKLIRDLSSKNKLDSIKLESIFLEEKPNQQKRISFNEEKIRSILPSNIKDYMIEEYIIKAIKYYKEDKLLERGDSNEVEI